MPNLLEYKKRFDINEREKKELPTRNEAMGTKNGKKIHRLFERPAPLGIMEDQLSAVIYT